MDIKTKSNFLQKKKEQRKKTETEIEVKSKLGLLHKNIRAFLVRKKILKQAYNDNNVQLVLFMAADISKFSFDVIKEKIDKILQQPQTQRYNNLKKIILLCMKCSETNILQLALKVISSNPNLSQFFQSKQYIQCLNNLLKKQKGYQFLNYTWDVVKNSAFCNLISNQQLFKILMQQFQPQKMDSEGIFKTNITNQVILKILQVLNQRKYLKSQLRQNQFIILGNILINSLQQGQIKIIQDNENAFIYLIDILAYTLQKSFEDLIKNLIENEKYKNLLSLVSDQEQLQYVEHRLTLEIQYQQFCQQTLRVVQRIFHYPKLLHILMMKSNQFRSSITGLINLIKFIYEDRKIFFVYNFLSDQTSLKEMSKQKKMQFYSALNMKLMTMDDEDFIVFQLFSKDEWRQIIQLAIQKAYQITKKMLNGAPKKQITNAKNLLFKKNDELQQHLKTLSDLLTNLNKKCLRTKKISNQFFINQDLDKILNTFKFSAGSRSIELMLKNFPFSFRFQSRIKKLKQFIKADKLNHDRSLFLQEQVDPDLVIAVRRGHQFLDAFDSCIEKDLRKKYKIVFFNEQGLQQEGIDGGGIIKQFINRVLKSSFSSIYGMFYQTEENQILPNSSCSFTKQYQFVGKIVGKAVYQSINIDQKFAQPFLNLLIGRQNTFEDLKFIDKQIYKSMVQIRRMDSQNLEVLQQSFTIQDINPLGQKKYVNLKNLSNNNLNKHAQVFINTQNKIQFVESYADYKCNKQLQQKTRLFRRGFLTVVKSQWLTMFSNQQLNMIISGSNPNYSIIQLKNNVVYNQYNEKSQTIIDLWSVLSQFTPQQKSAFLFYVTSCSRPPTLGFSAMKPLICIQKSTETTYLPSANTCMNVLRLPDYKNRQLLKQKLLYAINAKAGFQFA